MTYPYIVSNSPKQVKQFISVAGTEYVLTQRASLRIITNADNGATKSYTAQAPFLFDLRLLVKAGERVTLRNRLTLWVVALILSIRVPEPTPTAPAAKCAGYQNRHWQLPRELQNTPATHYVMGKHVCVHCADAFNKSMAAYERVNTPAVTEYVAVAAASAPKQENVVKVNMPTIQPNNRIIMIFNSGKNSRRGTVESINGNRANVRFDDKPEVVQSVGLTVLRLDEQAKVSRDRLVKLTKAQREILTRLDDGWGLELIGGTYRFINLGTKQIDMETRGVTWKNKETLQTRGLISGGHEDYTYRITPAGRAALGAE